MGGPRDALRAAVAVWYLGLPREGVEGEGVLPADIFKYDLALDSWASL
jgi:hypothetical protein